MDNENKTEKLVDRQTDEGDYIAFTVGGNNDIIHSSWIPASLFFSITTLFPRPLNVSFVQQDYVL